MELSQGDLGGVLPRLNWMSDMVDIKCKVGERVAIGKQEFIQVIKMMPEGVVFRLTTVDEPLEQPSKSTAEDLEWQFRHSE